MRNCATVAVPLVNKMTKDKKVRLSQETYDALCEIAEANGISVTDALAMTVRKCKQAMMHWSPFQQAPVQQETTVKISNVPSAPQQLTASVQAPVNTNETPKAASALQKLIQKQKGSAS